MRSVCDVVKAAHDYLKVHEDEIHDAINNVCGQCGLVPSMKVNLVTHMQGEHVKIQDKCRECDNKAVADSSQQRQ